MDLRDIKPTVADNLATAKNERRPEDDLIGGTAESDAIYRFAAWLTTRDGAMILGGSHDSAPPYSAINWRDGKGAWVPHAMQTLGVDYMALLLNWSWPGAGGLSDVWEAWPPARVYLMRWKIDFTGQGAPPNLNAWFIWDREHVGETVLRMLDRPRA